MKELTKTEKIIRIVFFVLLGALVVAFGYRLFFGIDSTDEIFNLANSYRIARGDKLLVEIWDNYQTGDAFLAPFIWAYLKLTGSTEGLVLASRLFYFLINLGIASLAYYVMREYLEEFYPRIMVSVAILFFAPFSHYYLWYDTASLLFMLVGMLCILKAVNSNRIGWGIAAGISHACMVFAYPTAIVVVVAEAVAVIALCIRKKKRAVFGYAIGGFLIAGIILAYCASVDFQLYFMADLRSDVSIESEVTETEGDGNEAREIITGESEIFAEEKSATDVVASIVEIQPKSQQESKQENPGLEEFGSEGIQVGTNLLGSFDESFYKIWNSICAAFGLLKGMYLWTLGAFIVFLVGKKLRLAWLELCGYMFLWILPIIKCRYLIYGDGWYNRAVLGMYFYYAILIIVELITNRKVINRNIVFFVLIPSLLFMMAVGFTAGNGGSKSSMALFPIAVISAGVIINMFPEKLQNWRKVFQPLLVLTFAITALLLFYGQFFEEAHDIRAFNGVADSGIFKGMYVDENDASFLKKEKDARELNIENIEEVTVISQEGKLFYLAADVKPQVQSVVTPIGFINGEGVVLEMYLQKYGYPKVMVVDREVDEYCYAERLEQLNYVPYDENGSYIAYRREDL